MRTLSVDDYINGVALPIEEAIEDALFDVFKWLAEYHGFEIPADDETTYSLSLGAEDGLEWRRYCSFHDWYKEDYRSEFRDKAIELFELMGMDVRPESEEW